jgi:hypothetical protein
MMHVTDKIRKNQQKRIADQVRATDCYSFFNLLTGPELLDFVEGQLPEHRERLYPPTVTLSLFVTQALVSDGSCQNAVNGYGQWGESLMVWSLAAPGPAPIARRARTYRWKWSATWRDRAGD